MGKIQLFNSRLASAIPGLLSSHPGLQVYLVDAYSNLNDVLDNYASLGFTTANVGAINDPSLTDDQFFRSRGGLRFLGFGTSHGQNPRADRRLGCGASATSTTADHSDFSAGNREPVHRTGNHFGYRAGRGKWLVD